MSQVETPVGPTEAEAAMRRTNDFPDEPTQRLLRRAPVIAGTVVMVLLVSTYVAYFVRFADQGLGDQETWGQFGDFVGGTLNSLVGLATLLVLACTVRLQMQQIELSRKAVADAQEGMRLAAAATQTTMLHNAIEILGCSLDSEERLAQEALAFKVGPNSGDIRAAKAFRQDCLNDLVALLRANQLPESVRTTAHDRPRSA